MVLNYLMIKKKSEVKGMEMDGSREEISTTTIIIKLI